MSWGGSEMDGSADMRLCFESMTSPIALPSGYRPYVTVVEQEQILDEVI